MWLLGSQWSQKKNSTYRHLMRCVAAKKHLLLCREVFLSSWAVNKPACRFEERSYLWPDSRGQTALLLSLRGQEQRLSALCSQDMKMWWRTTETAFQDSSNLSPGLGPNKKVIKSYLGLHAREFHMALVDNYRYCFHLLATVEVSACSYLIHRESSPPKSTLSNLNTIDTS